jgi:autotransporter-associated beta strand protein
MKPKFRSLIAPLSQSSLVVCVSLCAAAAAHGASQTWDGDTDGNWTNAANWVAGAVPGGIRTGNGVNADVATFNAVSAFQTIAIDNNRFVNGLAFTSSAGAHTFTGGLLYLSQSGSINVAADVTNPQVISNTWRPQAASSTNGIYSFINNATDPAATLTFNAPDITLTNGNGRPSTLTLAGSNTGENVISSNLTNATAGQTVNVINKNGAGTWVLSGANIFTYSTSGGNPTGGAALVGNGIRINGGTLAITNNAALGSDGTANRLQTSVNDTGTLELRGGITVNNGVSLNLNTGGMILSNGSNATDGRINVSTAGSTMATIATTGASDVFTIGNAANDLTGGAADTVLNVSGPGTVSLTQSSNYAGGWSINSGTVLLGNGGALGAPTSASVSFGAASTGKLVLNSFSPTVTGLSTHATPGSPVVENGNTGTSTLTVNNAVDHVFAGSLNDGASGILALTKGGAGTLTLNGANSYTGDTAVNAGALIINGNTATQSVSVSGGSVLGGGGSISGGVTINGPSRLAPGSSVGTLTVGSLTIGTGAILDYEFAGSNDMAVVTTPGGLVISGGGMNLYQEGGTTQFNTVGTYNLIQYSGSLGGSTDNLSVLNPDPTKNYQFSADGTHVKLSISESVISEWGLATGGDWASGASWTGSGVPNASGTTAIFGDMLASPGVVTLNGSKTVGTIAFDNANSYTISPASTEFLILDNTANSGNAQIIGTGGSHQITAPVVLASNTVANIANANDAISISGIISGSGNLIKGGPGSVSLSGANTFDGEVVINGGRLDFASGSLGEGGVLSIGGGALRWSPGNAEDISASRTVEFLPGDAAFDTNGNDVVFTGSVGGAGPGALVKTGAGSLSLAPANSYLGNTTVSGGTLVIGDDSALGTAPGVATPGSLTIGAATLQASGTFGLAANRGIALASVSSTVHVDAASTLTYGGIIGGAGKLNVTGPGILNLSATNAYVGGTRIVTGATLNLSGTGTPGSGQVAMEGGTLTLNRNLYNQGNIFVDAGQTGTVDGLNDRVAISGLTGSGTITLISRFGGVNAGSGANGFRLFTGNGGFSGTVHLKSGVAATVNTFAAHFNGGGFDGNFSNATIHMTDNARLAGVNNSGGNTMTIGSLTGDSTAILAGADYAGTHTYNIGVLGIDNVFPGTVTNGSAGAANITKSGAGSLTFTGTNAHSGTTTVNGGIFAVVNATALGDTIGGTTVAGGNVDASVTITGGLTLGEAWTLGGRQLDNADSAHIRSLLGDNVLTGLVTPGTGGNNYNIMVDAGSLVMAGDFVPAGTVTGARSLQLIGFTEGEWSGSIQDGTAVVTVNLLGSATWTLSGNNTYTGDTFIEEFNTLELAPDGELRFAPGANGTSGRVTGNGTANLDGTFVIDVTNAEIAEGNQWILVNAATAVYGETFAVAGFSKSGVVWTRTADGKEWTFDQSDGTLSLALVPSGYATWASDPLNGLTEGVDDGATDDPDDDGIDNMLEFVLGGNPSVSSPEILPELDASGANFIFTFDRNDDSEAEVTLIFQYGSDLVGWTDVAVGAVSDLPVLMVDENADSPDLITITIPKGINTGMFGRLRAVK